MFFRKSNLFFLLVLIYFLLVSGLPVEAQAPIKKNATAKEKTEKTLFETMKANPWSKITGFRSAKFGADEKSVYRAIAKDFKIAKSKVRKEIHSTEKTTAMEIVVPDLFSTGGTAKVGYIFGHKSKKLGHINVLWGQGAAKKVDGRAVVEMANILRRYFMKKRYKEETLVINGKLSDTQTIIFRGSDKNDRMILVLLNTTDPEGGNIKKENLDKLWLKLSYMSDPDNPDVASRADVKEGEF